jgi:hypothetical protein
MMVATRGQVMLIIEDPTAGADPGFPVSGGVLKKIVPSGGRRKHFWGISCEKSRCYAKFVFSSNFRGGPLICVRGVSSLNGFGNIICCKNKIRGYSYNNLLKIVVRIDTADIYSV